MWRMTLKNNSAPLLCHVKLCTPFHCHMWIENGVTVRNRLSGVLTSETFTLDLWPWPFAWTSLPSMVITPENFLIIRWWKHSEKGLMHGQTDGQTEWTIQRAAWSQLKTDMLYLIYFPWIVKFVSYTDNHEITSIFFLSKEEYELTYETNIETRRTWCNAYR